MNPNGKTVKTPAAPKVSQVGFRNFFPCMDEGSFERFLKQKRLTYCALKALVLIRRLSSSHYFNVYDMICNPLRHFLVTFTYDDLALADVNGFTHLRKESLMRKRHSIFSGENNYLHHKSQPWGCIPIRNRTLFCGKGTLKIRTRTKYMHYEIRI